MSKKRRPSAAEPAPEITDRSHADRAFEHDAKLAAIDKVRAVIDLSMDGEILSVNDVMLSILGYQRAELVGQHHSILV